MRAFTDLAIKRGGRRRRSEAIHLSNLDCIYRRTVPAFNVSCLAHFRTISISISTATNSAALSIQAILSHGQKSLSVILMENGTELFTKEMLIVGFIQLQCWLSCWRSLRVCPRQCIAHRGRSRRLHVHKWYRSLFSLCPSPYLSSAIHRSQVILLLGNGLSSR